MNVTTGKQKLLGQFFSGSAIAMLVEQYLPNCNGWKVIDPMCGIGDLLSPFYNKGAQIEGIEIDDELLPTLDKRFPDGRFRNINSFSKDALSDYNPLGYDLVVTNPPYIRYQLQNKGKELVHDKWLSLGDILSNLEFASCSSIILDEKEKDIMLQALSEIPGVTDIAIPAWFLSMMLVKPYGYLAIVVPEAWITREYAVSVRRVLNAFFEIKYVFTDSDRIWFKDRAQVKTSVIIAQRHRSGMKDNIFAKVDLRRTAVKNGNLVGAIDLEEREFKVDGNFPECRVSHINQSLAMVGRESERNPLSNSVLSKYAEDYSEGFVNLGGLNMKIGQGLRTGANDFFYVSKPNMPFEDSVAKYFRNVIQGQRDLGNSIEVSEKSTSKILVYIQDAVAEEDSLKDNNLFESYDVLPKCMTDYIQKSAKLSKNGVLIPELSSVKPNIKKPTNGDLPRFWYQLPPLAPRHTGTIIIPRVNGGSPMARYNPSRMVVDANFSTLWTATNDTNIELAVLAILNSNWCRIQMEEVGTVMGGGALKLDAVQLKKLVLPKTILQDMDTFCKFGTTLSKEGLNSCSETIKEIDVRILHLIGIDDTTKADELVTINQEFLRERGTI